MKQTTVEVLYGRSSLEVGIPCKNLGAILTSRKAEYCDEAALIRRALQSPIKSSTLAEMSKSAKSVVIIADDITRPMPSELVITQMTEALSEPHKKDITILIANGLHRRMTRGEISERFGVLAEKYNIVNHDAMDLSSLADFGTLSSGNRLYLNKLAAECDLLIAEGFIEPHFFAGFSGGRKSILPGIAGETSVMHNHSPLNILHERSRMGSMKHNPINLDCEEACEASGLKFILNVALSRDKSITAAFAGHPIYAHREGCLHVGKEAEIFAVPADITITSNSGYPLDINLYQAVKGMVTAAAATKKGGVIIMAAECSEGAGHGSFFDLITSCGSVKQLWNECARETPAADKWQVQEYAKVLKDYTVILVSTGIDAGAAKRLFLLSAGDLREALEKAFLLKGREASVNVIPEGPMIIPVAQRNQD